MRAAGSGPAGRGGGRAGRDPASGPRRLTPQHQCRTEPVAFCQNRPNLEKLEKKKKWNLSSNWCFGHLVKTKLQIFWLKGRGTKCSLRISSKFPAPTAEPEAAAHVPRAGSVAFHVKTSVLIHTLWNCTQRHCQGLQVDGIPQTSLGLKPGKDPVNCLLTKWTPAACYHEPSFTVEAAGLEINPCTCPFQEM